MFLPPELYRPIIQNIDARADLRSLLFVSRLVSCEAERFLYHIIHITPETSSLVLLRLSHCQRVARYVQELGIFGDIALSSLPLDGLIPDPSQYWDALNHALCALTNLRVLILSMYIIDPRSQRVSHPPSSIFSNSTFKLEVFKHSNYIDPTLPHLDLSQVKELHLESDDDAILEFPPNAFLSLEILSSSRSQFEQLGTENIHRIKALELIYTPHLMFERKFTNLTSLKFYFRIDAGIQYFPSLRYLYAPIGIFTEEEDPDLSVLIGLVSTLKDLEKLCLFNRTSMAYPANLHVTFFSSISSLQELDLIGPQDTKSWDRNGKDLVDTSRLVNEDEWRDPRWLSSQCS